MSRKSVYNMAKAVEYSRSLLKAGTPMIVFDLETTGLSAKTDRILSFSAIKVVVGNGIAEIKGVKDIFINPGFHIPESISNINGITDETVKDCPMEEEAFQEITEFLGEKPFLCGYNSVSFDEKFLQAMYERAGTALTPLFHIDVLKMAREKLELASHKLENVAKELGVNNGLTFHQSMDDVKATFRVFMTLQGEYLVPEASGQNKADIRGISYWQGPNHKLERVYIQTWPSSKTFYDIYKKEWKSDDDGLNLDDIREQALRHYQVTDEKELVQKAKQEAKSPA